MARRKHSFRALAARRLSEDRPLPADFLAAADEAPRGPIDDDDPPLVAGRPESQTAAAAGPPAPGDPHVIGKRLGRLVSEQIAVELEGQQLALGISLSFERRNLAVWARRFRDRSAAAFVRATRLAGALAASQVDFELPATRRVVTHFRSPARALRAAKEQQRRTNARLRRLSRAACRKGDAELMVVAQWMLAQQTAEERELRWLVDLVRSGANLFEAEALFAGRARAPSPAPPFADEVSLSADADRGYSAVGPQ